MPRAQTILQISLCLKRLSTLRSDLIVETEHDDEAASISMLETAARTGLALLWRPSTKQPKLRSDLIVETESDDEAAAGSDHFSKISPLEKQPKLRSDLIVETERDDDEAAAGSDHASEISAREQAVCA